MYAEIVRLIEERFPHGIELGFVDYDDSLTQEQALWYVTGDMEQLFYSVSDWEHENRWYGTDWYIEELASHVRKSDPSFDPDDDWIEIAREALMDLDRSDILGDLVKRTTYTITLCKWLIDEDSAQWGKHDVEGLIEALGVPDTADNRTVADEMIVNAPTDLGMAFSAYEVAPAELSGINMDRAAIRTDWLPVCYGNPFTGAYWAGTFKLSAPATVPLSELTPDSHMMDYGPGEVYGEFPYELECERTIVEIGDNN